MHFAADCAGVAHPDTTTTLAGVATLGLYTAILAPVFWVSRVELRPRDFRRIILTLWAFHTLSCTVGVLQVYFPGRFQPSLSTVLVAKGPAYVRSLEIQLASGQSVLRPMGLTDVPGGVGAAGLFALLFGLGLLFNERRFAMKAANLGSMAVGLFCIYLSQNRSALVTAAICVLVFVGMLAWRGELGRSSAIALVVGLVVVGSFLWAASVGGRSVTGRLATLTDQSPGAVYYHNRGHFLKETLEEYLPRYPLGAGLGRWGMIHYYFGRTANQQQPPLWAEIQWTAWLYDGGAPLILVYLIALAMCCVTAWRIAMDRALYNFGSWGALVFAYNIGALAVTFNYALFSGQGGMEFWLLNACLFAAACHARSSPPAQITGGPFNPVCACRIKAGLVTAGLSGHVIAGRRLALASVPPGQRRFRQDRRHGPVQLCPGLIPRPAG